MRHSVELYFATFPLSCFLSSINVITTKFLIVTVVCGGGGEGEDKKRLTKYYEKVFSKGKKYGESLKL